MGRTEAKQVSTGRRTGARTEEELEGDQEAGPKDVALLDDGLCIGYVGRAALEDRQEDDLKAGSIGGIPLETSE